MSADRSRYDPAAGHRPISGRYDDEGNLVFEEIEPVPTAEQDAHEWYERYYDDWLVNNVLFVPPIEPDPPKKKDGKGRRR